MHVSASLSPPPHPNHQHFLPLSQLNFKLLLLTSTRYFAAALLLTPPPPKLTKKCVLYFDSDSTPLQKSEQHNDSPAKE